MLNRSLRQDGHTRRYLIIEPPSGGWEVRQEQDSRIVRRHEYRDWHRVERAWRSLTHEIFELEAAGWRAE